MNKFRALSRLWFVGSTFLLLAIIAAVKFGLQASPVASIAMGGGIGVLSCAALYRAQLKNFKKDIYPYVPTPRTLYSFVGVLFISAPLVVFSEGASLIKLAGAAGFSACVGFLVGQILLDDK